MRLVEAASIAELEARLNEKADWDLVLLDLNMPGAYGFSGLVLLRGQYPQVPVVMISAQEEAAVVQRSREFGASGFIPKSSPLETLQQAVRAVLDGDTWWPPQDAAAEALSEEAKAASAGLASLTPQQFRVLTMVCEGLLNKQIAYDLNVSEATVKAHVTAIFRKSSTCAPGPRPRCCCNKWRRFPLLIERRLNAFFDQPAARLPAFRIDENPTCRLPLQRPDRPQAYPQRHRLFPRRFPRRLPR